MLVAVCLVRLFSNARIQALDGELVTMDTFINTKINVNSYNIVL